MRRYLFLFSLLFLLPLLIVGCSTSGGLMDFGNLLNTIAGEEAKKNKNPFIEAEIDLLIVDELSAMIKLNQAILERIPISYEDPWPELLNDYYRQVDYNDQFTVALKERYDRCLEKMLKDDFSFYRVYNLDAYLALITIGTYKEKKAKKVGQRGSRSKFAEFLASLIPNICSAAGSSAFIKGCKTLGLEFEHAKLVLSAVPFGCDCPYFRKEYLRSYIKSACSRSKSFLKRKKCDFFYLPTEVVLNRYLKSRNGIGHWIDLKINRCCFRTVEGEQLGTFKQVFYSLFEPEIRRKMEEIDSELFSNQAHLETIKLRLKDKNLSNWERSALEKRKEELELQIQRQKEAMNKLYKGAFQEINITKENIKKAKKLMQIVSYIERSFIETMEVIVNLTVKMINDARSLTKTNVTMGLATYPILRENGVLVISDERYYRNRFSLVMNKLIRLHVNYFGILGYAIAQKKQVSRYKEYLNALLHHHYK